MKFKHSPTFSHTLMFIPHLLDVTSSSRRAVLRDATPRSLVLLDEMGKGTEVDSATSLSAALLEQLADRSGTNVIFATHLHDLVRLRVRDDPHLYNLIGGKEECCCTDSIQYLIGSCLGLCFRWSL